MNNLFIAVTRQNGVKLIKYTILLWQVLRVLVLTVNITTPAYEKASMDNCSKNHQENLYYHQLILCFANNLELLGSLLYTNSDLVAAFGNQLWLTWGPLNHTPSSGLANPCLTVAYILDTSNSKGIAYLRSSGKVHGPPHVLKQKTRGWRGLFGEKCPDNFTRIVEACWSILWVATCPYELFDISQHDIQRYVHFK